MFLFTTPPAAAETKPQTPFSMQFARVPSEPGRISAIC